MGVGVVFEMLKTWLVLRDEAFEEAEHVAFDVRIGILIYGQAAGCVLGEQYADTVTTGHMGRDL